MKAKKLDNIINEIINEEKQNYNIDFDFINTYVIEYYKDVILKNIKNGINLIKENDTINIINIRNEIKKEINIGITKAFYNQEKNIIVVFKDKHKKDNENDEIIDFLITIYHEIRHVFQENKLNIPEENFIFDIEFLAMYNNDDVLKTYNNNAEFHKSFYFEIDSDIYAISKAKEYIEKNNIENFNKEIFEKKKNSIIHRYISYNFDYFLETALNSIKNKNEIDVHNLSKTNIVDILQLFFNDKAMFKNLDKIINNERLLSIDVNITKLLLSSNLFLENLDINNLSDKSKFILNNILEEKIEEFNQKNHLNEDFYKNKKIDLKRYNKTNKYLTNKLELLNNIYSALNINNKKTR